MTSKYMRRSAAFRLVFLFVAGGCDKGKDDEDESAETNDGGHDDAEDGAHGDATSAGEGTDDGADDGAEGADAPDGADGDDAAEGANESDGGNGTESTGEPEPAECMKECVTCGDVVMFLCDPGTLCPASEPLFTEVFGCVCAEQCTDDCGSNVCAGGQPSPECGSCIETSCAESFAACQADQG